MDGLLRATDGSAANLAEISYDELVLEGEYAIPDDPQCAFKLSMDKMLDDLKQLFGRNWWLTANTGIENIIYIK